jgi:hypothetical protein
VRGRRIFDWRFLAMLTVMLLMIALCFSFVKRVEQADSLIRIAAQNAEQVQRLNDQIDIQAASSNRQRAQLREQNRQLRIQLDAVLKALREHGIQIPKLVVTRPSGSGVGSGPKGVPAPRPPEPKPRPGSPAPTGTPTPTGGPTVLGIDLGPICAFMPAICTVF